MINRQSDFRLEQAEADGKVDAGLVEKHQTDAQGGIECHVAGIEVEHEWVRWRVHQAVAQEDEVSAALEVAIAIDIQAKIKLQLSGIVGQGKRVSDAAITDKAVQFQGVLIRYGCDALRGGCTGALLTDASEHTIGFQQDAERMVLEVPGALPLNPDVHDAWAWTADEEACKRRLRVRVWIRLRLLLAHGQELGAGGRQVLVVDDGQAHGHVAWTKEGSIDGGTHGIGQAVAVEVPAILGDEAIRVERIAGVKVHALAHQRVGRVNRKVGLRGLCGLTYTKELCIRIGQAIVVPNGQLDRQVARSEERTVHLWTGGIGDAVSVKIPLVIDDETVGVERSTGVKEHVLSNIWRAGRSGKVSDWGIVARRRRRWWRVANLESCKRGRHFTCRHDALDRCFSSLLERCRVVAQTWESLTKSIDAQINRLQCGDDLQHFGAVGRRHYQTVGIAVW